MKNINAREIFLVIAIFILILAVQSAINLTFHIAGFFSSTEQTLGMQVLILQAIIAGLVVEVWMKEKK